LRESSSVQFSIVAGWCRLVQPIFANRRRRRHEVPNPERSVHAVKLPGPTATRAL